MKVVDFSATARLSTAKFSPARRLALFLSHHSYLIWIILRIVIVKTQTQWNMRFIETGWISSVGQPTSAKEITSNRQQVFSYCGTYETE